MFVIMKKKGKRLVAINLDRVNNFILFSNEIMFYHSDISEKDCECVRFLFDTDEDALDNFGKIVSHIESGAKICFLN